MLKEGAVFKELCCLTWDEQRGKSGSSSFSLRRDAGGRNRPKRNRPKSGQGSKRVRESCVCVFVCLFVFVHVCNTSVGMFILKLQYVQVFTYSMLTITYYILSYVNGTWKTFCTTFSLFEQRFVPIKCQTSGKKRTKPTYTNNGELSMFEIC